MYAVHLGRRVEIITSADEHITGRLVRADAAGLRVALPEGEQSIPLEHVTAARPALGDLPVATPPVPTAPAGELVAVGPPDQTMPDVGLNPRPLPPAPADGKARHEKPSDGLMSRVTGGFKALLDKPEPADQQGDDQ